MEPPLFPFGADAAYVLDYSLTPGDYSRKHPHSLKRYSRHSCIPLLQRYLRHAHSGPDLAHLRAPYHRLPLVEILQ
ncbi:MAG: hypothetical protein ACPGVG_08770, partial [Mycobacterium sp.]